MDIRDTVFRFPLTRTLPLLGAFVFLLAIVISSFFVGGYHPIVTVVLWLALIASAWVSVSDLVALAVIRQDGLQIRFLSLQGVQTYLVPWADVQELTLLGHQPDVLKLWARQGVSIRKWTLPAHLALAQAVVRQAGLQPEPTNQPPGVPQAFNAIRQAKSKSERYQLHWRWWRAERELGNE